MHIGVNVELSERIQKDFLRPRRAKKTFPEKTRSEIPPWLITYFLGAAEGPHAAGFSSLSVRKNPDQAQTPTEQHYCGDNPGTQWARPISPFVNSAAHVRGVERRPNQQAQTKDHHAESNPADADQV